MQLKPTRTHFTACNLCEAMCGITVETRDGRITAIRGDADDPHSKGYICPKGTALQDIHEDPDRLRQPVKRTAEGCPSADRATARRRPAATPTAPSSSRS